MIYTVDKHTYLSPFVMLAIAYGLYNQHARIAFQYARIISRITDSVSSDIL